MTAKGTFYIPRRYLLVLGTFTISLFMYIDRACISAAKVPIANDLMLTDKQMGWVLAIFALGYALFQVPGGLMADKFGPRKVLAGIIAFWSLFTALTAAAWGFISLMVTRFFFGAGEAGAFPSISRATFTWIPLQERGIVQGINFSGSRLGAAFAMPLIAWLIAEIGWRNSFIVLGISGIIFAVFWYILFRDKPEEHFGIAEAEKQHILKTRQQTRPHKVSPISAGTLFSSANVWLAMLQYFGSNFTFFFTLTWLFPHLQEKYSLDLVDTGIYTALPLLAGFAGNLFSGILVDALYRKGRWKMSRRIPAIIGFSLVIVGLIGSIFMTEINGAITFISIALFGADMTLSPSWSFCIDIGKEHSGAVSGTMNMAGNIGSFITALAFPYLLAWTGTEIPFFILAAFLSLISILAWLRMNPENALYEG